MAEAHVIDLRSDTVTKPTPEMRKAMFEAEVGDDVMGEDPTVLKLEQDAATLFGKEAALYVPTGTMGNLISIMAHCWGRGLEILVGDQSHIYMYEQGGAAQFAGVQARSLATKLDGTFDLEEIENKIRPLTDSHQPHTALLCLENTHNRCGGAVLPVGFLKQAQEVAKAQNIAVHMDGARILNASTKLKLPVSELLQYCDSVSVCLSKGLGAPCGTLICGTKNFISRAYRCRKALGGGMRQVGVIAAAGLVALHGMAGRLQEDHDHALKVAKAVAACDSQNVKVDLSRVQTNIVLLELNLKKLSLEGFCSRLQKVNDEESRFLPVPVLVKMCPFHSGYARLVLHADIKPNDVDLAIKKITFVIKEYDSLLG